MMKKATQKVAILSFLLFLGGATLAQTPVTWSKAYGGNSFDEGHCIKQTADGGYIISGSTDSDNNGDVTGYKGGRDIWVVKTDNMGNLEWQSAYGGYASEPWTEGYSHIIPTTDGGYFVMGESLSNDGDLTENKGNFDLWVFKIDNDGDIEWQKSLGGSLHDGATSVILNDDGSFMIAGYTSSSDGDVSENKGMIDGWLVKLSADGNIIWEKTIGGTWTDGFRNIRHTEDGGYILTGSTLSNDGDLAGLNPGGWMELAKYWIVKLDENAEIEWQSVIGGTSKDEAQCIIPINGGGYIVAGNAESNNGDVTENFGEKDWWVVRLDDTGTIVWEKTLGGSERDEVRSMEALSDGSAFFIVGTTQSTDGHITTNPGGKKVWLVKMDFNGDILTNQCYGAEDGNQKGFYGIESTDGGIVITGNGDENSDLWIFKIGGSTMGIEDLSSALYSVYPNPATDVVHLSEQMKTVTVYSISGQKLFSVYNAQQVNVSSLSSGTYFLQAENESGKTSVQKIIKK
jgi:hypothetical protein